MNLKAVSFDPPSCPFGDQMGDRDSMMKIIGGCDSIILKYDLVNSCVSLD